MRRELWMDLDGTLLGSHSGKLKRGFLRYSIQYFRNKHSISILKSLRLIHEMRRAMETPRSSLLNEARAAAVLSRMLNLSSQDALFDVREMANETFLKLEDAFFPMEGAKAFIQWASVNHDLVLATNPVWPESVVKLRLIWAGISPSQFLEITHAGSMHATKPHVEYYQELLSRRKPDENEGKKTILMVGDSLKKDLPVTKLGICFFCLKPGEGLKQESALMWSGGYPELQKFIEEEWK